MTINTPFPNKEGQPVPQASFAIQVNGAWQKRTTQDIFNNKTVVVFSLPGAFTPTCSSSHLPRYNQLATTFKNNGVDEIVCISVNDTFVMNAWAQNQECDNISLIPDGAGIFTEAMGLLVDKSDIGFGKRSWRYSMLVRDGIIEKMFIEPVKPGDPFEVSDADTLLDYINPNARKPQPTALFTKVGCPYCEQAKQLLTDAGIQFEELVIGKQTTMAALTAVSGRDTVPQVFVAGQQIGGSEALADYLTREK